MKYQGICGDKRDELQGKFEDFTISFHRLQTELALKMLAIGRDVRTHSNKSSERIESIEMTGHSTFLSSLGSVFAWWWPLSLPPPICLYLTHEFRPFIVATATVHKTGERSPVAMSIQGDQDQAEKIESTASWSYHIFPEKMPLNRSTTYRENTRLTFQGDEIFIACGKLERIVNIHPWILNKHLTP